METADWWRDVSLANNNNNNNNQNINHRFSQSSLHAEESVPDCDNAKPRQHAQHLSTTSGGQLSPSDGVLSRRAPRPCRYQQQQQVPQAAPTQQLRQQHRVAPSAAAAFFHRASERLYYTRLAPRSAAAAREGAAGPGSGFSFSFSDAVRRATPSLPPQLLRRLGRRDLSHTGKVKVLLRVRGPCGGGGGGGGCSSVLTVDARRRLASLCCPQQQEAGWRPHELPGDGAPATRMFAFDGVFTDADASGDSCNGNADSQAELNAATLCDVIHAVINGYDGCVFCFGHPRLECGASVRGAVGSALSWLFAGIEEQRRRTGARFSVRVSALSAGRAAVTDLLADHNSEAEQSPGELLRELGAAGHCPTELRASSAEHAASHLDHAAAAAAAAAASAAPAAAANSPLRLLLYRLLVYQHRVTPDGQVIGGRSRLHLLEVSTGGSGGGGSQDRDKEMPLSGLGNLLLAVFNGSKNIPYRNQRAAQVVRECLSAVTSHAAMVVHACRCADHYRDTLTTLQLAARVHRLRHRSSSARGLSAGSRASWEPGAGGLRRSSSSELEPSSSELSADTVIYLGGRALHATIPGRRPPVRHPARPLTGSAAVEETWVDGPRAPRQAAPRATTQGQPPLRETWVDGPRSEAAMECQKRLMVSEWLASQVPLSPTPTTTTTTTTTTQPPRPEADGAADRQRDHSGAPGGVSYGGCVSYQRMNPPSPQQLRPHSNSGTSGDGGAEGSAEADVDDADSARRVEGVETRLHVWEPEHPQPPLAVAAEDLKLELSFEVELQLGGGRRLSGEGREGAARPGLVACRDACVQVTEEEISQYMGEGEMDHPLRVLSQENMTVVSTFADSASGSYSLDGMRVRQPRPWGWGWESPPPPPPLCRSQSASAADVRLAPRRPAAAGRASDDADVDDWEGSLASEPPPVTGRRVQRGMSAITPDLIRGARPAHRSLPAPRRTAAPGGPAASSVGGPEYPWTLQRPDGASNPSVAEHDHDHDHDPANTAPAAAVPHSWEPRARPPAGLPHAVLAPRRDKEESARRPAEVDRHGAGVPPPPGLEARHRPAPALPPLPPPPPPPPPPPTAGQRRERTGPRAAAAALGGGPLAEAGAPALPPGGPHDGDVVPTWRQRLRLVASKLSCNCG